MLNEKNWRCSIVLCGSSWYNIPRRKNIIVSYGWRWNRTKKSPYFDSSVDSKFHNRLISELVTFVHQLRNLLIKQAGGVYLRTVNSTATFLVICHNFESTFQNYPTETSPCPSMSADNSLYKFKNNIKQRFTAEHSIHQNGSSSGYLSAPPAKKSKTSEATAKYDDSPSNDSQYESPSNDFPSDLSRHYDGAPRNVAIFALHGDGTFYIPLTVDYTCLIPYLGAFSLRRSSRNPPLVLHPVTLSVCFQQNGKAFKTQNAVSVTSSDFGTSSLVKMHK